MDWSRWPNFREGEFRCKHCGDMKMEPRFMDLLQRIRRAYGKPMYISSGYRCGIHNAAVSSTGPNGPHTTGLAADVRVSGQDAHFFTKVALVEGARGVGISQKGPHMGRFIHIDLVASDRPTIWSY
jgi:zinc D-Ala-D-Ala carboxypeptidase